MYTGIADMRKGFDGLSGLVVGELHRDAASGEVFIFINKRRNQIKILHWEQGGFILYHKRLERGTFEKNTVSESEKSYDISWTQLVMMIEGVSIKNIVKRKRYKK